jgi:hypothetical protein
MCAGLISPFLCPIAFQDGYGILKRAFNRMNGLGFAGSVGDVGDKQSGCHWDYLLACDEKFSTFSGFFSLFPEGKSFACG